MFLVSKDFEWKYYIVVNILLLLFICLYIFVELTLSYLFFAIVWYIVLLSLFTVSEGRSTVGGSGFFPSLLRRNNKSYSTGYNELAIVPHDPSNQSYYDSNISSMRGGAVNVFPAGYNPFGHSLTELGEKFLAFEGSLDSDLGKFLSTLKGGKRKTLATLKEQWQEITRVSKKGQSMRIWRTLDDIIEFCLKAGFID